MLGTLTINGSHPLLQGPQRSMICSLIYVHSNADDVTVEVAAGDNHPVNISIERDGEVYIITFPDGVGGSIRDGSFALRVSGETEVITFHRLFGDVNGDATVSSSDEAAFNAAYGSLLGEPAYNPAFDYNGDGEIAGADLAAFTANAGKSI